jgi:hypothetical protein
MIKISFRNIQGLRFRIFLEQFLPWLMNGQFTTDCLALVNGAEGKTSGGCENVD